MEIPIRVGRLQTLKEHFQSMPSMYEAHHRSYYEDRRGGCFTISFPPSPTPSMHLQPTHLVFRNFYAATLRLVQIRHDGTSSVLLDEYTLMQYLYCEDEAQKWHVIPFDKLQSPVDFQHLASLSIFIFQPSLLWVKYELQNVKLLDLTKGKEPPSDQEKLNHHILPTMVSPETSSFQTLPMSAKYSRNNDSDDGKRLVYQGSPSSTRGNETKVTLDLATRSLQLVHQLRGLLQ